MKKICFSSEEVALKLYKYFICHLDYNISDLLEDKINDILYENDINVENIKESEYNAFYDRVENEIYKLIAEYFYKEYLKGE